MITKALQQIYETHKKDDVSVPEGGTVKYDFQKPATTTISKASR